MPRFAGLRTAVGEDHRDAGPMDALAGWRDLEPISAGNELSTRNAADLKRKKKLQSVETKFTDATDHVLHAGHQRLDRQQNVGIRRLHQNHLEPDNSVGARPAGPVPTCIIHTPAGMNGRRRPITRGQ